MFSFLSKFHQLDTSSSLFFAIPNVELSPSFDLVHSDDLNENPSTFKSTPTDHLWYYNHSAVNLGKRNSPSLPLLFSSFNSSRPLFLFGSKLWMKNFKLQRKRTHGIWLISLPIRPLLDANGFTKLKLIMVILFWSLKDTIKSMT